MTPLISGRIVVPAGAPREIWMGQRGEGVTASEVWEIARGGIKTWRRILTQKMNGSTFRGTGATRAGTAREAALLDEAAELLVSCEPNAALWAAADNDLHRATPDAIGVDADNEVTVVEVKSHEFGWEHDGIPSDHLAQLQWQMKVRGARVGLYGFEVRDEDDQPPLDGATWIWVARDEEMIAWLTERADAFLAWREAGCPAVMPLPDDVETARAAWVPLKRAADAAAAAEKTANAALKKAIDGQPYARRFGHVGIGEDGGYQLTVSETRSIDETAWKTTAPEEHARIEQLRIDLAFAEAAAARTYPKTTRKTTLRYQEA
ncbi:hypothetical protein [Microbacterium sp. IEGM 1404]|uniref:hypothetical protein n=1 Tax=Microbacterium sp. IEGM 1404 TaxID=3047084 RepID=UPI0024B7AEAB|nr:hypothetical protein [Microbacterium sp. IEGM 1404]MDI9889937.1 hypothetical protein [Microbacterium sp. IEGM 1404]